MQHLQLALPRRRVDAATSAAAARRLASLLTTLRALARTGGHSLLLSLHRSRSREAAQVLRRYRNVLAEAGANGAEGSVR